MRRYALHPRLCLIPLCLTLAVASCSDSTGPGGFVTSYHAYLTGIATIDSVLYDNGLGVLVKVTAPNANFTTVVNMGPNATAEVRLYGTGTAAGTAKLIENWMTATGVLEGDSTSTATVAATKFTLTLAKRSL